MTGYVITWNDVESTDIPQFVCEQVERDLLGEFRDTFVPIAGRAGSWHFPEQRGRRTITMECYILADSFPAGRRSVITAVANWLDVGTEARLIIGDDPEVFYNAVLTNPSSVREWRNLGKFTLVFSVDPYAYDVDASAAEFQVEVDEEFSYDFGLLSQVYPVIEITNDGPTILEGLTVVIGEYVMNVPHIIDVGATITINSIGMAVLGAANDDEFLTGVYDPTEMIMAGVSGNFPLLLPGVNQMEINSEQITNLTVRINYRKRYRN